MSARESQTINAEERIDRLKALLHAIYCAANGDTKPDDPGNADTISRLAWMAEEELAALKGVAQ